MLTQSLVCSSTVISLNSVVPLTTKASDEKNINSKIAEKVRRLQLRLDIANNRYDMLISRMNDLEQIRMNERIERRQRRRRRQSIQ
jgi:hypothetical protein